MPLEEQRKLFGNTYVQNKYPPATTRIITVKIASSLLGVNSHTQRIMFSSGGVGFSDYLCIDQP